MNDQDSSRYTCVCAYIDWPPGINKAKLDTNAILIHDAVLSFCGAIDNNCFEALRKALAPDGSFADKYTYENVALNDQSAKATETVAALKSEQEKITAFKNTIDNALQWVNEMRI